MPGALCADTLLCTELYKVDLVMLEIIYSDVIVNACENLQLSIINPV